MVVVFMKKWFVIPKVTQQVPIPAIFAREMGLLGRKTTDFRSRKRDGKREKGSYLVGFRNAVWSDT